MAKPKTGLLAILGGPSDEEGSAEEAAEESAVQMALKDMYAAMKSGDWTGAETAFRDAKAACDESYESESEPEEL